MPRKPAKGRRCKLSKESGDFTGQVLSFLDAQAREQEARVVNELRRTYDRAVKLLGPFLKSKHRR